MKNQQFDYQGALDAGYSDEEILPFLQEKHPKFDFQSASQSGYSPKEINHFLSTYKPKKGKLEQGARVAGQYALGLAQASPSGLVYDIATAPLASKEAQTVSYKQNVMEDIEQMAEQKQNASMGLGEWTPKDEEFFQNLQDQIKTPSKTHPFVKTADISLRGLAEKATGQDLEPEGVLEKAANWIGWIKDPKNIKNIFNLGLKPKELTKAILPGFTEISRGLSAGTALEMAEQGNFGPLGTIAAAITGDLVGHTPKGIYKVATEPKKTAAQVFNLFTGANSKKAVTKQLVEDFEKSGLQLDAGTLSGSNLVKMMQARLAQSGLTGDALENFRKELSGQITREYENIVGELGQLSFENSHQAGEAVRSALKTEETSLGINKEPLEKQAERSRSLQGRVSVEPREPYQENFLNRIAPQEFESNSQAGLNLKTAAEDIKQPIKEQFERQWTDFNEAVRELPPVIQPELESELRQFVEEHRGSINLGSSTPEYRVIRDAERLLESLEQRNQFGIGATVDELIKTKRTLADIANWEFGGSNFESAYKKLVGDLDTAISRSIQATNPELLETFQRLNAEYAAYKDVFENKNVKRLFEPKNQNYNALHNEFISNPDKLRSLEDVFHNDPRGQQLINQVKRDHAQTIIEKPNFSHRDAHNLINALGPEFQEPIMEFLQARNHAIEHPLPRAARGQRLGVNVPTPQTRAIAPISGRKISETGTHAAREGARKKAYEYLSKLGEKDPSRIFKKMDTIQGIRELKRVLSLTPEGRELFKELSRFKLAEMIDKKMKDAVTNQVKLGTFSNLLKDTKSNAIAKELLGEVNYNRLIQLQKNSGQLAKSAEKFFNASKSGTTITDMGLIGAAATGVLTGNPFMALPAIVKIGGSYVLAKLISDPVFLKEYQKLILENDPKKFQKLLQAMQPTVEKSILHQSFQ
jgi:hypothetical protein